MTTWVPLVAAIAILVIYLCAIIWGITRAVIDNIKRRKHNGKKEENKM